ncbi:hypothetical protein ACFLU6_09610 [Acidobacteriota bacterium]
MVSWRIKAPHLLIFFIFLFVSHACDMTDSYDHEIGLVVYGDGTPYIKIPNRASRGVPVVVEVVTSGGGCDRQGETEIENNSLSVTVTPYDYIYTGSRDCPAVAYGFQHAAEITFTDLGVAKITVVGKRPPHVGGGIYHFVRQIEVID